jgi:hypothetical protein
MLPVTGAAVADANDRQRAVTDDQNAEKFGAGSRWSGAPRALLEVAIRRHGGWDAWQKHRVVSLRLTSLSGLVPRSKGVGRTFPIPSRIEVRPRERSATFFDYPQPGGRGTYTDGALALIDGGDVVVASDADPRPSFRGWRKLRRWRPIDALYFFGYALTHYHSLPFTLVDARPLALRPVRYQGRRLTGVEVELPSTLHTHSRRQTFYFEEDGLLRRHDYVADIVGFWARGAHFWSDYVTADGIQIARRRHVVARLGRRTLPFVALHADLMVDR